MKKVQISLYVLLLIGFVSEAIAKDRTVKGYITEINADRTALEIWKNKITVPQTVGIQIKDNEKNLRLGSKDLRIGMYIEAACTYEKNKYLLTAAKLIIDADQFEPQIQRTAYLHQKLENLERMGGGWTGHFFLDGQRVRIEPHTEVVFKLNREEQNVAKKIEKTDQNSGEFDDEDLKEIAKFKPLKSLEEVRPGDICEFTGSRNEDGSITALRLVFQKNTLEANERKLFKKLRLKEKEFDEEESRRGEIKLADDKFKTYYSKELQEYITKVGNSLVPEYQKGLNDDDPRKLDFRFYVIDGENSPNAFCFPNGVIGINTAMLLMLENEAQLASVVGHEIAHALNEHTYRQLMFHRKKRIALGVASVATAALGWGTATDVLKLTSAAITNGYQRFLEDQADRYGLRFAADRGYNPMQAVQVWINMTRNFGDSPTNFFWSSHNSHTERIAYLLLELRNNFPEGSTSEFEKMELGTEKYIAAIKPLSEDPKLNKLRKRMTEYRQKYEKEEAAQGGLTF